MQPAVDKVRSNIGDPRPFHRICAYNRDIMFPQQLQELGHLETLMTDFHRMTQLPGLCYFRECHPVFHPFVVLFRDSIRFRHGLWQ